MAQTAVPLTVSTAQLPAPVLVEANLGPKSYVWGYIQGTVLVLLGFGTMARAHAPLAWIFCAFTILVGFCILRRNRLIIPLFFAYFAVNMLYAGIIFWLDVRRVYFPGFEFGLGLLYLWYYVKRRDEFDIWF